MVLGFMILALEWPVPPLKDTRLHRSWVLRIVLLAAQAFLTILFYQVCLSYLTRHLTLMWHISREQMQRCIQSLRWLATRWLRYAAK